MKTFGAVEVYENGSGSAEFRLTAADGAMAYPQAKRLSSDLLSAVGWYERTRTRGAWRCPS